MICYLKVPLYKKEKQIEIIKNIENFEKIIFKKRDISHKKIKLLKVFLKSKTNEILFGKNSSLKFNENTLKLI